MEPRPLTAGEVVAGNSEDFADGRGPEGMDAAAVDIESDVEGCPLFQDIESGAIAFQFPLAGAERSHSTAVLVVDVIPVLGGLDETDSLVVVRLRAQARDDQYQDDGNDDSVHNVVNLEPKIQTFFVDSK